MVLVRTEPATNSLKLGKYNKNISRVLKMHFYILSQ